MVAPTPARWAVWTDGGVRDGEEDGVRERVGQQRPQHRRGVAVAAPAGCVAEIGQHDRSPWTRRHRSGLRHRLRHADHGHGVVVTLVPGEAHQSPSQRLKAWVGVVRPSPRRWARPARHRPARSRTGCSLRGRRGRPAPCCVQWLERGASGHRAGRCGSHRSRGVASRGPDAPPGRNPVSMQCFSMAAARRPVSLWSVWGCGAIGCQPICRGGQPVRQVGMRVEADDHWHVRPNPRPHGRSHGAIWV